MVVGDEQNDYVVIRDLLTNHCNPPLEVVWVATKPIVFLQSLNAPDLCFVTLPLLVVDPAYQLAVTAEDLAAIGLGDLKGQQPVVGRQVQAYTIMAMTESGPAANLLAPIIVNISPWRDGRAALGIQAVRYDNRYAHDQLLVGTSC